MSMGGMPRTSGIGCVFGIWGVWWNRRGWLFSFAVLRGDGGLAAVNPYQLIGQFRKEQSQISSNQFCITVLCIFWG
jgi:hypothetical protein